jgi:hypothetical protein
MHRAAALLGAALCIPVAANGATGTPVPTLPAGSDVSFVSESAADPHTVKPGYRFKAHLAADLTLGSTVLAPAGTAVGLIVAETRSENGAVTQLRLLIEHFELKGAGELPVALDPALVDRLAVGTELHAHTVGSVELKDDRTVIRVPLPFQIGGDPPNAPFTPHPFVTQAPIVPPHRGTPSPRPTPSPEDTTPAELRIPAVSPSPTTTPS